MSGLLIKPGDCRETLAAMPDNSIDSVVCDPPYALVSVVKRFGGANAAPALVPEGGSGAYARASAGFMGKTWDTGETAFAPAFWAEVARVLKPGGHVVAFSGTRTYHRLACAIEDAGFEIRDQLAWVYGTGFHKSHSVEMALEKTLAKKVKGGGEDDGWFYVSDGEPLLKVSPFRHPKADEWFGWGTALKPAWEPIVFARKPLSELTVAANVLRWGTGAINIGACRIETDDDLNGGAYAKEGKRGSLIGDDRSGAAEGMFQAGKTAGRDFVAPLGRFPANLIHDGSDGVLAHFPSTFGGGDKRGKCKGLRPGGFGDVGAEIGDGEPCGQTYADSGSAARFFYCAKAGKADRAGSKHPTVKPVAVMRWLVRMVTPPGGVVLDPFAGSGTTGAAALAEGFGVILCERESEYIADIQARFGMTAPVDPATTRPQDYGDLLDCGDEPELCSVCGGSVSLYADEDGLEPCACKIESHSPADLFDC